MSNMNDLWEDALEEGAKIAVGKTLARTGLGGWLFFFCGLFGIFGIGVGLPALDFPLVLAGLGMGAFCIFIAGLMLQPSNKAFRIWMIVAAVVLLGGLFVGINELHKTNSRRLSEYNRALNHMQNGNYEQAVEELTYLAEIKYRDSVEKLDECNNWIQYERALKYLDYQDMFKLKGFAPADEMLATPEFQAAREDALAVGSSVVFGTSYEYRYRYHQASYPKHPIRWKIIARDGDKALLISLYETDELPFNNTEEEVGWADCTLRQWLNDDFYNTAFTAAEQSIIELTLVDNAPEAATQDYLFLLSYPEVCKYMPEKSQRKVGVTYDQDCEWLLRKLESTGTMVPSIHRGGNFWSNSVAINSVSAVRPAMWVVLDPNFF